MPITSISSNGQHLVVGINNSNRNWTDSGDEGMFRAQNTYENDNNIIKSGGVYIFSGDK